MKKYKPLVVALLRPVMDTDTRAFLNSYDRHLKTKAELVVPVWLPTVAAEGVRDVGGTVIKSDKPNVPHLRSADAVSRIARDQPDRPVMVVCPGYTVFQHDELFKYVDGDSVSVSAAGGVIHHDVYSREQWGGFVESLRGGYAAGSTFDTPVVSPVVAAGPARLVAPFEYTRFAIDARIGGGAGHSSITALADWAKTWPWFKLVPCHVPWVAHGHWATQTGTVFDKGVAVTKVAGAPYALFHGWDRVKDVSRTVERLYG